MPASGTREKPATGGLPVQLWCTRISSVSRRAVVASIIVRTALLPAARSAAQDAAEYLGPHFPYSLFDALPKTAMDSVGGRIEVAFAPGHLGQRQSTIVDWIAQSRPTANPSRQAALTRGELAAETGCNIETIRYYEQIGLLPSPPRSRGGHRLYGDYLRKRLSFICRSRDLGFTLAETRGLLRLVDGGNYTCPQVEAVAREHVGQIQRKISDLRKLKRALEEMASQCSGETLPSCPIIDALFEPGRRLAA